MNRALSRQLATRKGDTIKMMTQKWTWFGRWRRCESHGQDFQDCAERWKTIQSGVTVRRKIICARRCILLLSAVFEVLPVKLISSSPSPSPTCVLPSLSSPSSSSTLAASIVYPQRGFPSKAAILARTRPVGSRPASLPEPLSWRSSSRVGSTGRAPTLRWGESTSNAIYHRALSLRCCLTAQGGCLLPTAQRIISRIFSTGTAGRTTSGT